MILENTLALVSFGFVSSITPGPNNLMLLASGTNFGFKRTIPHLLGVTLGFTLMVILVGFGLMNIFEWYPITKQLLTIFSVVYLTYLSYKIATSKPSSSTEGVKSKPMTFIQAVLFQWVNPKAWTMALSAMTLYANSESLVSIVSVAAIYGLVNLPCVSFWAYLGVK